MSSMQEQPGTLETDHVEVRNLKAEDLDWVVRIDSQHSGKQRKEFYKVKLAEVAKDTGVRISLAAYVKGEPAGFLMGRLYYGEFGQPEPVAILDSMGVSTAFTGQKVGAALMRQLEMNLSGLGIERLQTQVEWDQVELLKFFQRAGFKPAARLCLEKPVRRPVS
ncbi:MAG: GNAT family N-acetyltransferase [Polyangiaceae bacterium]|nr:GNAT family N-acetyltransferase [Polyangiaceae bacterium]